MIRKLQKRFIRIAVLVLTAAMVLVVGIVNTANLVSVRGELQNTLRMLAESAVPMNSGNLPEPDESGNFRGPGGVVFGVGVVIPHKAEHAGQPQRHRAEHQRGANDGYDLQALFHVNLPFCSA